jgi:signal transduction histidine kinase
VVVGVLTAIYREDELPCEAETSFLAALADQATMAAATARLVAAKRKVVALEVALEERHRLARELHDTVAQSLYGIEQGARMALDRLDQDPPRVAQPIEHVLQLAEAGQAEMRALIFALRPESLEKDGLVTALNTQIEVLRARHGIAAQTITSDEPEAPIEVKQVLHRIAQEAVHNTVKHSRARRVDVHLEANDSWLVLQVTDDGVGFNPDESFPGHFGLHSMRERALEVGGSLEVESSRGRGTRIVVRVPSDTLCPKRRAPPTQPSTEGSRTPSVTS